MKNLITLDKLTGLSNDDLADVFVMNPRAYMAVYIWSFKKFCYS